MHKSVIRLIIYFCGSGVIFYAEKKLIISQKIQIIFNASFLYVWHIFDKSWTMPNERLVCIITDSFELINERGKCNINVI